MSFFADIIADSRRNIVSEHRLDPMSGSMPVQANPSNPAGSELGEDSATGNEAGNNKVVKTTDPTNPKTTFPVASVLPQTSPAHISAPSASRTAETDDHVLQDRVVPVPSTSVLVPDTSTSRLNAPVEPTVQMKVAHNTQSFSASPKVTSPVSGEVNAGHKKSTDASTTDAVQLITKQLDQLDPMQEQSGEKRHTNSASSETSSSEQYVLKQDDIAQAPSIMTPQVVESGAVISEQSRREDGQQGAEASVASAVMAAVQVESTVAHARPVHPPVVNAGHMKDAGNQQSRVQIGQVNVVIEQAATPRRRASAVAGNGDYASRNFLKSL